MVSSVETEGELSSTQEHEPPKPALSNGAKITNVAPQSDEVSTGKKKPKPDGLSSHKGVPSEGLKDGKLSGKELKEKAKAEKAARRAKEKQGQQGQPVVDLGTSQGKQSDAKTKTPSTTGRPTPGPKGQHKRVGSNSAPSQKLPIRPSIAQATPVVEDPPKENKNVALFDHLYGPPRRTSLAGASKDVHPAVLALGLQMRNYVICGSNARCVATLLAFKKVSVAWVLWESATKIL